MGFNCPFRGFCVDEAKKSCVCVRVSVRENSEFYRGALARVTFSVSEVKEACPILVKSAIAKVGVYLKGPQKEHFLSKNEC